MVRNYNYRYNNPFNSEDMNRRKDSIHSVPFWVGFLVIAGLWGIFGFVYLMDIMLPTPLNVNDETDYPDCYITGRAMNDLKYLTDLGPKVTGSYENEYVVIDFLTTRINSIISEANPSQYIEYDVQSVSGGYYLNDVGGYMNIYDKVQNVIVKLHGQNNISEHSILINAHFDTVPSSPGGSDDGIHVANMLEILRVLSQSNTRQMYNVIFLFNGAEETPLQASHGYITQHKWANESKILINLEASGAGGKLILFQTGPQAPWLLKYYQEVPHPYGSVLGEEIFQSGLIPSDTDFRIFRDFGNMIGVDMAYFRDGYRYHTKYDTFSNIRMGTYQHGGDNTLSLVKSLANAPEVLEQQTAAGKPVFFEVFGWFLIYYSQKTALIVNFITIGLSIGSFIYSVISFRASLSKSTLKYFGVTITLIVVSWLLAAVFMVALALVLDLLNKTMSWYGRPWFIFSLYVVPTFVLSGCLLSISNHQCTSFQSLSLGARSQLQVHLLRLIWTFILLIATIMQIRSAYLIMILVLFSSVGFLIIQICRLEHTVRTWQIIYISSLVVPIITIVYQAWQSLLAFIPITGRLGSDTNPELYIGTICLFFTLLSTTSLTVLTNLLRQVMRYFLVSFATFAVFFGLLYTPLGFPYNGNEDSPTPQRHWLMHTQRQFFNESFEQIRTDSGIIMYNMDRNSPSALNKYVKELSDITPIQEDCDKYTLCAIPLIHSKVVKKINYTTWIPSQPSFPANETLTLSLVSKEALTATQVKFNLKVTGPDKLMFYITPRANVTFVNTSLIDTVKPLRYTFQGRLVYVILYQLGKSDGTPLTFDFIMETSAHHKGPVVDLAVSGRYVHENRIQKSAAYLEFLGQFPKWAHPIAWVAAYQSYIL
ncbi:unnamed protein product [Ceutorhynchus assimilis]|uniref:FXNA-like protease n=1 Tax=Ceutorhynchus assimilis TaxID=467358 RepID=A0A9N9MRT1_9CUCU|nr:unnamed protein product [Ceutorhynchus assimilis]